MAEPSYARIGNGEWRNMMQWGWGIYKSKPNQWDRAARCHPEKRWVVIDATTGVDSRFTTHEAATDFVRSEIARQAEAP